MIDIFMEALLGALVKFGNVITVEPGVGAVATPCRVVILTMFAAETFDPRFDVGFAIASEERPARGEPTCWTLTVSTTWPPTPRPLACVLSLQQRIDMADLYRRAPRPAVGHDRWSPLVHCHRHVRCGRYATGAALA